MEPFGLNLPLAYLWLPLVFIAVFYVVKETMRKNSKEKPGSPEPPGPWGLPFVGHLPLLGREPYKTAMAWKAKYGPIVGLRFGSHPTLIISDYKLAKEALTNPAFAGRPRLAFAFDRSGGREPTGIVMSQGQIWREQRSFTVRRLRELSGFGTKSMEPIIVGQVERLVQRLRNGGDGRVCVVENNGGSLFNIPVLNVIWSVVAGQPFEHDDPEMVQLTKAVTEALSGANLMTLVTMFMPWIGRWLPASITRVRDIEGVYKPVFNFLRGPIEAHRVTHDGLDGKPENLIDAFLDETKNRDRDGEEDATSSFHPAKAAQSLVTTLTDLFGAGTETTTTALSWVCLLLAKYPRIQEKLATEIGSLIGTRAPSLANRPRTPYTNAVLHEVLRFRPLLPLGVFHSALEDTVFGGYAVQKGTIIFANVYEAHFNEERWDGNPHVFRPERWLDEDGEFVKREGLLVFGGGKRVCLGEQMARDEMYLFTVGLVQAFVIGVDENDGLTSLEPKVGGTTYAPHPARLVFKVRE